MAVEWQDPDEFQTSWRAKTCGENTKSPSLKLENLGFTEIGFQLHHDDLTVWNPRQEKIILTVCILTLFTVSFPENSDKLQLEGKISNHELNKWRLKTKGPEKPKKKTAGDGWTLGLPDRVSARSRTEPGCQVWVCSLTRLTFMRGSVSQPATLSRIFPPVSSPSPPACIHTVSARL